MFLSPGRSTILVFFTPNFMALFIWGSQGGRRTHGVWKNRDFRPISHFTSEMIQYRAIVTMDGTQFQGRYCNQQRSTLTLTRSHSNKLTLTLTLTLTANNSLTITQNNSSTIAPLKVKKTSHAIYRTVSFPMTLSDFSRSQHSSCLSILPKILQ